MTKPTEFKYYIDGGKYPIVVFENSRIDGSLKWYEGYCVEGQHFEIENISFLEDCMEITKNEYKELTKGFYTPKEYVI